MLDLSHLPAIGDAIRDAIVTYKTNEALIEADRHRENGRWTYGALQDEAERFAALIQGEGFAARDRCAIVMQNQAKWLMTALGAFWAGATLVPLDYKLTVPEQLALVDHAKPRVLVTEYATWLKMREHLQGGGLGGVSVLVTDAPPGADLGAAKRWEQAPVGAFSYTSAARQDVACIVYSSGTSGTPKGCMLTHDNYLCQAEILGRLYPIEENDRYFSVLPTNHAIDFMCGFIVPLLFGAAVVHQRTLRPQFLRASMKKYGVTHIALVPTILKNLEKRIRERLDDLPEWKRRIVDGLAKVNEFATVRGPRPELSRWLLKPIHDEFGGKLRLIFAGGAFIERNMAEFFYSLGLPVVIGYGLTEACTVVSVNDLKPFRADSVGKPVPGIDVEIRAANEAGVGQVWVRGPTVMKGYLDAPELTRHSIVEGWLDTGDLGFLDVSGHLKLVGRVKNMIVTEGGKNIYPEDIEGAFEDLPDCEQFCVFAANYIWPTAKMTDEQLIAVIRPVADAPSEALLERLRTLNRKLPDFKRLSGYVVCTEDFPATASLKIKREALAELLRTVARENAIATL
jgi:long-chain acyl-CoA synthetase